MAKLNVIKEPEGDRSPFLRGIMVQSLVDAGLVFPDAYALANEVRKDFQDRVEVSSPELKARVAELLQQRYRSQERKLYEAQPHSDPGILVHTSTRTVPFSVGILARALETCTIPMELAMQGAHEVLVNLRKTGHREIDHKTLRRVIYKCLRDHCSEDAANRYLSWRQFENSGIPLILLVGGASGSGKSKVSSELAYRLDITRHQSTDMMREIIRSYLSPQMVPTLGYSSTEAWRGLAGSIDEAGPTDENSVVAGFLSQLSAMKLALETTIARTIKDNHHLILEGVHVVPSELNIERHAGAAIFIPIMIASTSKKLLLRQFQNRNSGKQGHKSSPTQKNLEAVWELQSWLLENADEAGIAIIENGYIEDTVRAILDIVTGELMKHFPAQEDEAVWDA